MYAGIYAYTYVIRIRTSQPYPSQAQHACNLLVNPGNFSCVYAVTAVLGH